MYAGIVFIGEVVSTKQHAIPEQSQEAQAEDAGRRRFLSLWAGILSAIAASIVAAPLVGMFLGPLFVRRKDLWLALGSMDSMKPDVPTRFTYSYVKMDGWFEKTVYGTAYAVLLGGRLVVLSNICTHLGCGVRWDPAKKAFLCPCHNGVFARDGGVVSGPPPKPLTRFKSRVSRGRIEILIEEA